MLELQTAINRIESELDKSALPTLDSATVVLSSKIVDSGSVSGSLVLTSKREVASTNTDSLTMVFKPGPSIQGFDGGRVGNRIGDSVVDAMRGIAETKGLELTSLKISAGLDISYTETTGIEITLAGITFGAAGSSKATRGHSITLLFKNPEM